MATAFSGGTYVNTTFTGDTKANIITAMQTQLTNAGWTVVSGGGTTNLLMQTAQASGSNNQGRVRFKDNGGSCVQVTIENVSGTKAQSLNTSTGGNLLPATSKTFRILASKFRFEVFTPGVSAVREFVCAGILYIPTPYQGVITEAIYMQSNSVSDSDTSARYSFRTSLTPAQGSGNAPSTGGNCAGICNANLMDHSNNAVSWGSDPQLRVSANAFVANYGSAGPSITGANNLYRWHDLALDMCDPLMGWGIAGTTDEALIRGQVYDWTVISDAFAVDTTDTWTDGGASHNWFALTSNNVGAITFSASLRGTIWVATS